MGSRDHLSFREKTEVFLVTKSGQVVAQDHKKYIMFAGGGCDPGESILTTARREVLEEVGAKVSGLKHLTTVDWKPNPMDLVSGVGEQCETQTALF